LKKRAAGHTIEEVKFMKPFDEMRRYAGREIQVFGIREATLAGGRERGVKILQVQNGAGLEFTVVPDRAMDIADFKYKGTPCAFISKNGILNPMYFVEGGLSCFYRNFTGGMLYTCGITHMGTPGEENGRLLGLHGPLTALAAEGVSARVEYGEIPVAVMRGTMRQTEVYREHIVAEREIRVAYGENKVFVRDRFANRGYTAQPFMLLYHFNFGYPLLCEDTRIVLPEKTAKARNETAKKGFSRRFLMEKPEDGREEECYFFELHAKKDGSTKALVLNDRLGLGLAMTYRADQLPCLTEWKSMAAGDYALGLNPGTNPPLGRAHARRHGNLMHIEPGEVKSFDLSLEIIEGKQNLTDIQKTIKEIGKNG
jgi:hypothetical protein